MKSIESRENREHSIKTKDPFIRERDEGFESEMRVLSLSRVRRGMQNLILILKCVAEYLLKTLNLNYDS